MIVHPIKKEGAWQDWETGRELTAEERSIAEKECRNEDRIILSSGRTIYAHVGIVGINPDLDLRQGYDGDIAWPPQEWHSKPYTKEDMAELADMMLSRWQRFKDTLK